MRDFLPLGNEGSGIVETVGPGVIQVKGESTPSVRRQRVRACGTWGDRATISDFSAISSVLPITGGPGAFCNKRLGIMGSNNQNTGISVNRIVRSMM